MNRIFGVLLVVALIIAGVVAYQYSLPEPAPIGGDTDEHGCLIAAGYSWCAAREACERPWERYCTAAEPKPALFVCEQGKSIEAIFYPSDDAFVDLKLSDERALSVPHATSASGARYANDDESFVFWNKGDTAFVIETGTTTFANCTLETL